MTTQGGGNGEGRVKLSATKRCGVRHVGWMLSVQLLYLAT